MAATHAHNSSHQILGRRDLDPRQRQHGRGQAGGRRRHRQSGADLRGAAQHDRPGRHHHHLGGGAGVRPAGGRRASLRPRQVREPVGARHHRPALSAGRRHSGRGLWPPARGHAAADHFGDPLRRARHRHRREFLARPRAAPRRARNAQPGARGRRAAFRLRRARLLRRHRRPHSRRPRLLVGRCGGRDRGGRHDRSVGPQDDARDRGNPARPCARGHCREGRRRDPRRAGRGRHRADARAHGRPHLLHRSDRQSAAHLSDRPRRGDQAQGASRRQRRARRCRPHLHRQYRSRATTRPCATA